MFTKNTIANFEGNGKARFYGLFLGEVDTIDILLIMDPTVCVSRLGWDEITPLCWNLLETTKTA